ncbi:hypothetical protein HAX54_016709 [Datura stramonium]|uniref:Uncharacterized protein n=1 Tax=Datura stramonium TaxID=4076 RepID=A0ABS8UL12_DATST|nr:hypothetical protein [Datura stramonium]
MHSSSRCENTQFIVYACRFPSTMPLKGNKKQHEAAKRKEIAKKQQLRDEPESDSSSRSEEKYEIDSFDYSAMVTTRVKAKAKKSAAATFPCP